MSYLSHGKLSTSLQRYIQVDIDDIFVGMKGTRLTPVDVEVCWFELPSFPDPTEVSLCIIEYN